jgi:hypothetical protein
VRETLAVRLPAAVGAKETETVHVAFTASIDGLVGQLLVCVKSGAFVPVTEISVIVSGPVPVFLTVDVCAALLVPTCCEPKVRLAGVSVTAGAGAAPVPVSDTLCGLPAASSPIWMLAVRVPAALGVKVVEIVQAALTASVEGLNGHVFVWAKSPAFAPLTPTLEIVKGAVPELVSVTDCAALVVPVSCEP